ncbi:DUF4179 domain-containing protein [Bacillus sp. ISL-37]|uniref:DUF4179 domain-containing protein n=1 Tax=Bacillus sp. ISL-37 TaxID=2819123 RepID=UPI001BEBAA2A|nr:DUF4179 domain-containing protein [Bacillus sp. ISL-37]MBT2682335.1 DUF4179 domain-containing protein [Bacillus sp. ISL-37]
MSDQFPDIKNEMNQISVPVDKLDAIIAQTVSETKVKKSKKRVVIYSMNVAIIGFSLFIGSAMVSPAMAKVASNIPVVGTFFNDIGDEGLRIAGQKGLTQVVDQTAKDNGITLTINEVFYDGTRLTLGYTQESLLPLGELERPVIKVDGKEINFSSGYSGEFLTPQKYKGVIDITPTEELPEEFEMEVRIDAVGLVPGNWSFKFPVKQSNEVTVIRPSMVNQVDGAEISLSSLKIGPAGTDLNIKVIADPEKLDPYSLGFYLLDDKGKVINFLQGSGSGETVDGKEHVTLQSLYEPLEDGARKVKIIPYDLTLPNDGLQEVIVNLDKVKLPFTMSQGDYGNVVVNDIEYKENRTVIYFDIESDGIIDDRASENPIWLFDADGKNMSLDEKPFAERIKGNSFKQEFATGKAEGLKLKTNKMPKPVLYEEFVIEIP